MQKGEEYGGIFLRSNDVLAPCFKAFASVVFVSLFFIVIVRIVNICQITVRDSMMTPLESDISISTEFILCKSKLTLNQARLAFRKESGSASLTVTHMRLACLVDR